MKSETNIDVVREAVQRLGGYCATARRLSTIAERRVPYQMVQHWCKRGRVPEHWVPALAFVTGLKASDINPLFKDVA